MAMENNGAATHRIAFYRYRSQAKRRIQADWDRTTNCDRTAGIADGNKSLPAPLADYEKDQRKLASIICLANCGN